MHAKSEDQSVLRSSFIPGFIQCTQHNQNYGSFHLAGFEMGKVHFKDGKNYIEKWALGILLTGNRAPSHFSEKPELFDFLDMKGILENLFEKLHIENTLFSKTAFSVFHPGQQAEILVQDSLLGIIGQIHPTIQKNKDFRNPFYYAQIDLEALYQHANHHYTMKPLPLFPSSDRDLTIHVHRSLPIQKVFDAIHEEKLPLLESIDLKDIYESESLGLDRKSVTLRFVYRDLEKTTESQDVEKIQSMILPILERKLQGFLFT
jgi:phenylalanyl-tRNA synthetase beta chain